MSLIQCPASVGTRAMGPVGIRRRGFTLLELLVALSIFALLGGVTYLGLAQLTNARTTIQSESEKLHKVRLVFAQIEADLEQAVARPGRSGFGADEAAFTGDATSVQFTRMEQMPGSGVALKRVNIGLRGRQLARIERLRLDPGPLEDHSERILHNAVLGLDLRYWDANLQVVERWPPVDPNAPPLPRAVEVLINDPELGPLRRLIILPETTAAQ